MTDTAQSRAVGVRAEDLSRIWEPLTIGDTTVKNRIMMTAQSILYGDNNILGDRHIEYYRERAKGGCGLFICEQQGAHPVAKGSFHNGCSAWDPESVPQYAKLAEAVHEHGARQFAQLFAPGVHDKGTTIIDQWHPLWGVSQTASIVHHEMPMVMQQEHIDDLVRGFGQSALNVMTAGLDGVELHAAHSYLYGQFLSPAYNKRDDKYGGSIANRCRIIIETGEQIRRRCGEHFTLGVRISFDEFMGEVGIQPEDSEEMLEVLAATGLFDFFNISGGGYHTIHMAVAPMSVDHGFMLPFGKRAKQVVGNRAKVFIVGRIVDLKMAEEAIRDGAADMVAMTRAQMAEPHMIRKTLEGRQQEIVGCMGANECVARTFENRPSVCLVNPTVGREARWNNDSVEQVAPDAEKRVLVVGGGLGGMHTAQLAASRGHKVTLLEKDDKLGGHLNLLLNMPTRKEWAIAIDNLQRRMDVFGVDVRMGEEVTPDSLAAEDFDALVIATGSAYTKTGYSQFRPERDSLPGHEKDNVIDIGTAVLRALVDPKALGGKVLILDQTGDHLPVGLAEILAAQGDAKVEIVTPMEMVGSDVLRRLEYPHVIPRLAEAGVELTPQHFVEKIEGDSVEIYPLWAGKRRVESGIDTVVISIDRTPKDDLYFACRERFADKEVHRVGDCVAPRRPAQVTYEAEALGRKL
ncbi:MAG: FAD-dependent oxidoreductase [Spiribacter salinus]|uniref:FAD-dependent oxidoreductase n=1 Tax=Spiribacter salinus TaxID=1335746 RepID=A0A540VV27_9GAMM|nr:MAG: FAD-dependent oxidoreductase [Spiribacter salinus]